MSQACQIREYVAKQYVAPARVRRERQITIRAGDVHKGMGLRDSMPAVCSALGTNKFQKECSIHLIKREGPSNGANLFLTFKLL